MTDLSATAGGRDFARVNPPELGPPSGFSHAVVGSGRIAFLAGQTALDGSGSLVGTGIVEQFELALTNLLAVLTECGGTPADLAELTVYAVDLGDYRAHAREIGRVWRRLVGSDYPAMAAVGVTRLWDVEALVEVQGRALLG